MANTSYLTKEQLTYVDNTIRTPKEAEMTALSTFSTFSVPQWTQQYRYRVQTTSGAAVTYTDGATDLSTVDMNMTESTSNLVDLGIAVRYSRQQLGEASQANLDILTPMANRARRALAEGENKLIFNGNHNSDPALNVNGLTDPASKLGVQTTDAPVAFDDMTDSDSNLKIRNWLQDAVSKITHLAGYSNATPTLLLPQSALDRLDRPYNEYNPQMTVLQMITPWFDQIKVVPELEHQNWGRKGNKEDMGYICLTDSATAQIPVAQQVQALQQEYSHGWTTVPYTERLGGLVIYYPSAFVQLHGINKVN